MPEPQREVIVTRIALLELRDEQRLAQEGYSLLDEKRILLAAEMRHQLARLRELQHACGAAEAAAREALAAVLERHGLDELSVYPPLSGSDDQLQTQRTRLLGLTLVEASLQAGRPQMAEQPVNPSPEARACAAAYRTWLVPLVALAACSVSLRRLTREYLRTDRRARAIENVLLPEIESTRKFLEDQLESLDQEEIARLRLRAR